ncbi:Ig-like domain-containing protein [Massilia sp. CF038]|uniref:Ig-like domain-containing protein n=1 Tax=Massilia sp. CF038 TaxID=1881045 RepID=UPI00091E939A|nr:Ig-like domain-containing protein [Massilia sp. CF038]SHG67329.1 Ig-like domain (group 3) [Massilia sp. CF038]
MRLMQPFRGAVRVTVQNLLWMLRALRCALLLVLCAPALAHGALPLPQFLVVDYHPISKTQVKGSPPGAPLFDYVYRVDVRNAGAAAADVSGRLASRVNSVTIVDREASFGLVEPHRIKASSDTITVRARKFFDRRLDPRRPHGAAWRYEEEGSDDDDIRVPGLGRGQQEWRSEALRNFYDIKFQFLFQWAFTVRADQAAPVISQPLPQGALNTARPQLSAQFSDGASGVDVSKIVLALDGVDVSASARKSAAGVSYTPAANLAEGNHAVALSVADKANNRGAAAWSFMVDTIAPVVTGQAPNNVTNASPAAQISAQFTDQGAGIDTAKVRLWVDNVDVTVLAQVSAGAIVYLPAKKLADGKHKVKLTVPDSATNLATVEWSFGVDSKGVSIDNRLPADGAQFDALAIPVISATYGGAANSVDTGKTVLLLDGRNVTAQAVQTAAGIRYVPAGALSEGVHEVKLRVTDKRANLSEAAWTFTTVSAPEITSVSPKDVVLNAATAVVIAAQYRDIGAGIDTGAVRLLLDGVDVTAAAQIGATELRMTPASPLPQGAHVLTLTVGDKAGNRSTSSWRFTLDTGLPVISAQSPRDVLVASSAPTISASFQETGDAASSTGIDPARVKLFIDNQDVTAQARISASAIVYTPATALASGTRTVQLVVADRAGNTVDSVWSFTVDLDRPTIGNAATPADASVLEADALPVISAQFSDGGYGIDPDRVSLELDGVNISAQALRSATSVSYTVPAALSEGNHQIKLTVADRGGNTAVRSWSFVTRTAPRIFDAWPVESAFIGAVSGLGASYSDIGSGIDPASFRLLLDGADLTAQMVHEENTFSVPITQALADGNHQATLELSDLAGNKTRQSWSFLTATPPVISARSPVDVTLAPDSRPEISAAYTAGGQGLNLASVQLYVDEVDVTAQAQVSASGIRYTPPAAMAAGEHTVMLSVQDNGNGRAGAVWGFSVAAAPTYAVAIKQPLNGSTSATRRVEVVARANSSATLVDTLTLNGQTMRADVIDDGDASTVQYVATTELVDGSNTLTVLASFRDGSTRNSSATVSYRAPPVITILTPADKATLGAVNPNSPRDLTGKVERPVLITGRTDKPVQSVTINQQAALVAPGGMEFRFENFFLHEGVNLLSAIALDAFGQSASASVTVAVDQTAPLLSVEAPLADAFTSNDRADVRGVVNDAIEGWIGAPYPSVTVTNSANQKRVTAKVMDRFFSAEDVPLEVGANSLRVSATDQVGNTRSKDVTITRIASGSKRLTILRGNHQRAPVDAELPQPLTIVALANDGNPLVGMAVRFDILRGTGTLRAGTVKQARNILLQTDAAGRAEVWLTLGKQSGEAGNMVRVSSVGVGEDALFSLTAERGAPALIRADGGGAQFGETGSTAFEPLGAVVSDANENRVPQAPVTFTVVDGDAVLLDAQGTRHASLTVTTDKNGLAAVRPLFGTRPGPVLVSATLPNQAGRIGALFQLTVLAAQTGPTQLSGKVLNHTGQPLGGVRMSIGRTSLSTTTDANGDFHFDSQVPVGKVDLFIDGRTANVQTAQYPSLHFEMLAIRGQNNVLPHPIFLPPLLMSSAKTVGGAQDVTMTIPGFDGFEMVVKANSVTFPNGDKTGKLVISPVQQDKLPMVPPGGYNGFMAPAWTIQPSGTRFDPPLQIKMPNSLLLKAGETREIYQWDHDLATFVPIGRATVSEDGAQLISDSNSGVTKAGWGGTPSPPPVPDKCAVQKEPDPKKCEETVVVAGCPVTKTYDPGINKKPFTFVGDDLLELEPKLVTLLARKSKKISLTASIEKGDPAGIKWEITSNTAKAKGAKNIAPDNKEGAELSFEVDNVANKTGSYERSVAVDLTAKATMCGVSQTVRLQQDQKDIIRQEYVDFKQEEVMHTKDSPTRAFSVNAPARDKFNEKGTYSPAEGLNNPYSISLGKPFELASRIAGFYQTLVKAKSTAAYTKDMVNATPQKRAELELKIQQVAAGTFMPILNSVWRSPRHNYIVGGAAGSNHLMGAAADMKPGTLPANLKPVDGWCALREGAGSTGASEVLLETNKVGGGVDHTDHSCTGNYSFNHVHTGDPQ